MERIAILALVCMGFLASAKTIYVATTGDDTLGDGSESAPYLTPSNGIAHAETDDVVFLKEGTYSIDTVLTLDKPLTLRGEDRDTTIVKQSITTGSAAATRVVNISSPDARVESLWLRDGRGPLGGNVYMAAGVVSNCVVSHGYCYTGRSGSKGSNIYMTGGTISHSIVSDSKEVSYGSCGGGIAVMGPDVTIDTCLVRNNLGYQSWAYDYDCRGGGIYLGNYTGIVVQNCTVVNNKAGFGGGIYSENASAVVRNCIFADNTVVKQTSTETGYPNMGAADPAAWSPCISRCVIGAGSAIGDNVRIADPLFVGGGDYHLASAESPAVDWATAYGGQAGDLEGRVRGDKPDCGCYESDFHSQVVDQEVVVSFTPDKGLVGSTISFNAELVNPPDGESFSLSWKLLDANGGEIPLAGTSLVFSEQINTCGYFNVVCEVQGTVNPYCRGKAQTSATFHLVPSHQYVDSASSNPSYPYDSPECAAKTFAAIKGELLDGTTVHVADGSYDVTQCADIGDVRIFGAGMTNTVLKRSSSSDYTLFAMHHVRSCVSNLTLSGGTGGNGGSIRISGEGGTVSHCRIVSSSCGLNGGNNAKGAAISCDSAAGLIDHCLIETNTVHGIFDWGVCTDVVWLNNGLMRNSLIVGNTVKLNSEAHVAKAKQIVFVGAQGVIENCTIADNIDNSTAATALYVTDGGQVVNTIVANNQTPNMPESTSTLLGLPNWQISKASASNGVSNCCFGTNAVLGAAARIGDPKFANADAGDYRLDVFSPCRNRGQVMTWMDGATDLDGNPRLFGKAPDIGCYECQYGPGLILIFK